MRSVIYVAPTGSGKTVVAAEITRRAVDRHQRVLFLAHRREIIDQTSRKLSANGIPLGMHGIVLAGRERDLRPQAMVQVASIDTLLARGVRSDTMQLPPADIIIFDETHRIRGRTREYLISLYPDAVLLGLTATPCRGDGRGLGNIFETMTQAPQVAELIGLGFLVGARVFAPVDKDIATEGWDCPEIGCCILARPTKQLGLYRQMIGRVLRTAPGKTDAIILDHAGAWHRHGLPEDHIEWTLHVDARAENRTHGARKRGEAPALRECPSCKQIMTAPPPCVHCGWEPRPRGREVDFLDGELGLVRGGRAVASAYTVADKRRWYGEFVALTRQMGKKPGWAYHLYRAKFGEKPLWHWKGIESEPTPEVRSYARSRQIAFAKSRRVA